VKKTVKNKNNNNPVKKCKKVKKFREKVTKPLEMHKIMRNQYDHPTIHKQLHCFSFYKNNFIRTRGLFLLKI